MAAQRVRFMCSFGGKILPRPHDNQLRYVGGDTRMVAVSRTTTFSSLLNKVSKLCSVDDVTVKYQLPNEDLDALITVASDEDVENMMEEWERLSHQQQLQNQPNSSLSSFKTPRLRLFLFPNNSPDNNNTTNTNNNSLKSEDSRSVDLASLLDGSTKRETWFLDALNGGGGKTSSGGGGGRELERGRSEASSIAAEVPDCLFGLDNLDENNNNHNQNHLNLPHARSEPRFRNILSDNIPGSDPSSPCPPVSGSSPFCSTSSAPASVPLMPNLKLPPVKTKSENSNDVLVDPGSEPGSGSSRFQVNHQHQQQQVQQQQQQLQQEVGFTGYGAGQPVWVQQQQHPNQPQYQAHTGMQPVPVYYMATTGPPPQQAAAPAGQVRQMAIPGGQYVQQYPMQVQQQQQQLGGQFPIGYNQAVGPGQVYGGGVRQVAMAADMYHHDMQGRVISGGNHHPQQVYYGVRSGGGMVAGYPGGDDVVGGFSSDPNSGRPN